MYNEPKLYTIDYFGAQRFNTLPLAEPLDLSVKGEIIWKIHNVLRDYRLSAPQIAELLDIVKVNASACPVTFGQECKPDDPAEDESTAPMPDAKCAVSPLENNTGWMDRQSCRENCWDIQRNFERRNRARGLPLQNRR